jgi:parallel beta-helix repeat protein
MSTARRAAVVLLLTVAILTLTAAAAYAAPPPDIYVDDDGSDITGDGSSGNPYATITKGLSMASHGDQVYVLAGEYDENITLNDGIWLRGASSSTVTLRAAGAGAPVITVAILADTDTIIDGFTIVDGDNTGGSGGGISALLSSPTIRNCTIVNCTADSGGGIAYWGGGSMYNNIIRNNMAVAGDGGGILNLGSGDIDRNTIYGNDATDNGGGIYVSGTGSEITSNVIYDNEADHGGGIYSDDSQATIAGNTIVKNTAGFTLTFFPSYSLNIHGGGIEAAGPDLPTIKGCIVWGSKTTWLGGLGGGDDLEGCTATYSCIEDGDAGTQNTSDDPEFADYDGDDYRLTWGSPCIDRASASLMPPDDRDGVSRPIDGNVNGVSTDDAGAYEFDDTVDPVTTSDAIVTYTGSANITLFPTDADSLVDTTYWDLDGAGAVEGVAVYTEELGLHSLEFWSVDVFGNVESVNTANFVVNEDVGPPDVTPPVTTSDAVASYNDAATITLFPTDDDSGVWITYYRIDGGPYMVGTSIGVSGFGAHAVDFYSVDNENNVEATKTAEFTIEDTIPPTTSSDADPSYVGMATVNLSPSDGTGSGVAGTLWRLDGGPWTPGTVVETSEVGTRTLDFYSTDNELNVETTKTVEFNVTPYPTPASSRLAGVSRYDTAILASEANFTLAPTVVIASGEQFADALAASGLAGALDSPLLLTRRTSLSDGILDELGRLGATDVIIVGGTGAVSLTVEYTLEGEGYPVERIGGTDRYDTAALIGTRIKSEVGTPTVAFVARGDGFADALAVSPFAYNEAVPVLLTRTTSLPARTSDALTDLGVEEVVIPGGEAAVDAGVETTLEGLLGAPNVTRVAGADRYDTCAMVAEYGVGEGWGSFFFTGFATGQAFPDALAGGAASGSNSGVLLLTRPTSLPTPIADTVTAHRLEVNEVQFYGGAGAVSDDVMTEVMGLLP